MDPSRYAELFLTESREHLTAINHALLELERAGEAGLSAEEPIAELFRSVHTVKGMSATMGYAAVATLSHELESLLDGLRRRKAPVGVQVAEALFLAADALEEAIALAADGRADEADVAQVVAQLRALAVDDAAPAAGRQAARPDRPMPDGRWIRVRVADEAPMRGVRASMVVMRARAFGELTGIEPPEDALQRGEFRRGFSIWLRGGADAAEIERALLAVGDVEEVEILEPEALAAARALAEEAEAQRTAAAAPGGQGAAAPARQVRVDARRLDTMMDLVGELVITRGRLLRLAAGSGDPALEEASAQAARLIGELQTEILTVRMVPAGQVFDRFPRLVRDAARSVGRRVRFAVEGRDIELDRGLLDEVGDALVHLLRNAVDHGIEPPDERVAAGKPAEGRLTLSASRERSAVLIRVSDDGRGIDRGKVLARAKALGLADDAKTSLADEELTRVIAHPGFSTADRVTALSGRGVGVDAVQHRVRQLGGSLEVASAAGQGTTVTLRLPLTLAIVRALLAQVADETYALPLTHVRETLDADAADHVTVRGEERLVLRDEVLPLLRLRRAVGLPPGPAEGHVVVLELGGRRAGLVVDELAGQQEIVVKQYDGVRGGLRLFGGATILGDGAPALIVDVASLF